MPLYYLIGLLDRLVDSFVPSDLVDFIDLPVEESVQEGTHQAYHQEHEDPELHGEEEEHAVELFVLKGELSAAEQREPVLLHLVL